MRSNCLIAAVLAFVRDPRRVRLHVHGRMSWRTRSCWHWYWTRGGKRYHFKARTVPDCGPALLWFEGDIAEMPT